MWTKLLVGLLLTFFTTFPQDLYTELLKEQIKSIPLDKSIKVGSGKKELITFMNPDCPNGRKDRKALKPYLKDIKLYVFIVANPRYPENWAKASYIVCSKDGFKALDDVFTGKYDGNPPSTKDCPRLREHIQRAESIGVRGVPYNIILNNFRVIEGYSPALLEALGIKK